MKFENLASRRSSRGPALIAGALAVVLAGALVAPADGAAGDDESGPVITFGSHLPTNWYSGPVTLQVKATDDGPQDSGVFSMSYALSGASSGAASVKGSFGAKSLVQSVGVANEGTTFVDVGAEDWVGNTEAARTEVRIDATAPETHVIAPANGDVYALGQSVTADYSCSDDLSQIASCGGTYASGARLYTGAAGDYTVWVAAVDNAGNRRDVPVSYTVVDEFTVVERPSRVGSSEPRVGTTITGSAGVYTPIPDFLECQWWRDDVELGRGFMHEIVVEDLDHELYFQCTVGRSGIPRIDTRSDAVTPLPGQLPDRTPDPIGGEGRVGSELTFGYRLAAAPTPTLTPYWTRDGSVIPGTMGQRRYTLTPVDYGHTVSAFLRAEAPGYETRDYPAASSVVVDKLRAFTVTGQPAVAGTAQVGQRLSATAPTFTPSGAAAATPFEVGIEWLRDGTAVGRGASYQLTPADAGHRMTARVTASGPGYETARLDSAATGVVVAAPGGGPGDGPGQQPGAIASKTRLKLKALGKGRVRATITVVAGSVKPSGKVTIRCGSGKARTVTLKNGRAVVVLKKQRKGRAGYTASYAGAAGISASQAKAKTRVR